MTDSEHDGAGATCNCKVGRAVSRYDLAGLDSELVRYWRGEGDERYSTRQLATHVNQTILEAAATEAGMGYKEGEIENTYRLLTDDDVSSGTRVQTRNELERESVDVEAVEGDFVSHQTVYNHLTDCLEVSMKEPSDEERLERGQDRLGALQNRTLAVSNDTIERLKRNDVLDLGDFTVLVNITITCEDCQRQYTARELFERGSCECQNPE